MTGHVIVFVAALALLEAELLTITLLRLYTSLKNFWMTGGVHDDPQILGRQCQSKIYGPVTSSLFRIQASIICK